MKHQTELRITIREWLAALRQAGLSLATLEKYDWHMERLSRWLEEREVVEPGQISKTLLREWGAGLFDNWSAATVRQAVFAVRSFLNWCREEEIIDEPVARALRVPKVKIKVQRTLTAEEVQKLIAACDGSVKGKRDAALVSLMVDSGLRASEVCRLKLKDLQIGMKFGEGFVNVLAVEGKGGHVRPGYFGQATSTRLQAWLNVRYARPGCRQALLRLVSCDGETGQVSYCYRDHRTGKKK